MTVLDADPVGLRRIRRRKIFAVLAGLSVLGVGATVTLAAWTGTDYATGTFTSGTFALLGSSDGLSYANHTSALPATLSVTVTPTTTSNAVSPGSVVYMPYALELSTGTTYSATVSVASTASTNPAGYTYTMFTTTPLFGCSATSVVGTPVVAPGTALGSVGTPTSFTLAAPVAAVPQPTYLCIKVTAGTTIAQGTTTSATWQFTATSN